jgi:hypothetical protein
MRSISTHSSVLDQFDDLYDKPKPLIKFWIREARQELLVNSEPFEWSESKSFATTEDFIDFSWHSATVISFLLVRQSENLVAALPRDLRDLAGPETLLSFLQELYLERIPFAFDDANGHHPEYRTVDSVGVVPEYYPPALPRGERTRTLSSLLASSYLVTGESSESFLRVFRTILLRLQRESTTEAKPQRPPGLFGLGLPPGDPSWRWALITPGPPHPVYGREPNSIFDSDASSGSEPAFGTSDKGLYHLTHDRVMGWIQELETLEDEAHLIGEGQSHSTDALLRRFAQTTE